MVYQQRLSRRTLLKLAGATTAKQAFMKASVAVAPGVGFGEHGDGFVRIAFVENEQRIRQAARNIGRFLKSADATLHNVIQMPKAG